MALRTTPRGLAALVRAKLGVQARPPRKLLRELRRRHKNAAYRLHERATTGAAILSERASHGGQQHP